MFQALRIPKYWLCRYWRRGTRSGDTVEHLMGKCEGPWRIQAETIPQDGERRQEVDRALGGASVATLRTMSCAVLRT